MIRKHFLLPEKQIEWIKETSDKGGIPMSEVVRRIIDKHILSLIPDTSASESKRKEEHGTSN